VRYFLVLVLTCLTASAVPVPDLLQGRWLGTTGNNDLTIKGDNFSLQMGKTLYEGTLTRSQVGQQETVDLEVTACIPLCRPTPYVLDERGSVPDFRQTWRGIYAVEEGKLSLCFGKDDRPKQLAAGSGHSLLLFERPRRQSSGPAQVPEAPKP
jgi:hypothetical protein